MGCTSCGSGGTPTGCGSNGDCGSGSCNRMNTFDWISTLDIHDPTEFGYVEVSFKNGASKSFFQKDRYMDCVTGDHVVVSTENGYNVGYLSLSGELVRLQMKKKRVNPSAIHGKVLRTANERDLEKMNEARSIEYDSLVKARVISRTLGLDMKIGDVEYQADLRKATFYYTAEGRVDFRQLVRDYAKEFRVKVEMKQIGARQESGRIGGIGSCGRELCCSTWLSDFKTVTTSAARYQNIAINQTKLSGQCGRLKCCLNYELDTYMDALKKFPKRADFLRTKKGKAVLVKKDIFKGLLFYSYVDQKVRGPIVALDLNRVNEILALNKEKKYPDDLIDIETMLAEEARKDKEIGFADVTGVIELPSVNRKKRKNRSNNKRNRNKRPTNRTGKTGQEKSNEAKPGKKKPNPQSKRNKPAKSNQVGGNKKSSSPQSDGPDKKSTQATKSKNRRNNRKNKPNNQNKNKSE